MYQSPSSVAPGAMITVKNEDGAAHTVTDADGGAFDVNVDANKTATFTAPSKPGTYNIMCKYHPFMHGTLVVK